MASTNGRGGRRPGAGRKMGRASAKTREIADRAANEGITPLEMMLKAMRAYDRDGETDKAVAIVKDAAPYMHPRLAAIDHGAAQQSAPADGKIIDATATVDWGELVPPKIPGRQDWDWK